MQFPSIEFVHALKDALSQDAEFNRVSRWSDVKVLLCFGDEHYWMKLYGGKVIDVMPYVPLANPLGWDYQIAGALDTWQQLRTRGAGPKPGAALLNCGRIRVDGNMLEANRMFESTHVIVEMIGRLQ